MSKSFTWDEVSRHTSEADCWIVIDGEVFDVTPFLSQHPGGKKVILRYAGKDATKEFHGLHKPEVLAQFGPKLHLGQVSAAAPTAASSPVAAAAPPPTASAPAKTSSPRASTAADHKGWGSPVPFAEPYWYNEDAFSPYYKDTHREFRAVVRAFVDREIMPHVHEWDEAQAYPLELHEKAYKAGLHGACWPSEYGGTPPRDFDIFHELILIDELGRCAGAGIIWALFFITSIALPPILFAGSDYVKDLVARDVISGKKIIALAVTEPYAGSDVANLRTTAKREGDFFIVNGEKKFITSGTRAHWFTTAVRTGADGMGGVSLLLIDRFAPGVTVRKMKSQGIWASGTSYITFEDVRVPVKNLIGPENMAFPVLMNNFNHERFIFAAMCGRCARVCIEESISYARNRKTFGKRLIDHQVIRHKIAEMARQVETTHAFLEQVAYQMARGADAKILAGPISLLKVQSTRTMEHCAREASQVLGGASYIRGGVGEKVERLYREVRVAAIAGGSEEILMDLVTRQARL